MKTKDILLSKKKKKVHIHLHMNVRFQVEKDQQTSSKEPLTDLQDPFWVMI